MGQESSHELVDDSVKPQTLKSRSIDAVADLIKDGKAKKIVVMTGAGISTSAGIPDFRSPDTGLYANLARLNLPYAEAVFDISYFRENPNPFYALARELYPGKYKPTISHTFISLLAKKNLLRMLFTQNIDCLERAAGVPGEKIVEAHGSFATQRCIECKTEYPDDLMLKVVKEGSVPHCITPECNGLVKPDIVFFGEQLPESFHQNRSVPSEADLVIVMGTSLTVQPFASLPQFAMEGVPRVLLNLERVGGLGSRPDDVCILGDCDSGIRKLADSLGWREELKQLWAEVAGKSEEQVKENAEPKSKDETLEAEIEKLTSEINHTLNVSQEHQAWLEEQVGENATKVPAIETESSTKAAAEPTKPQAPSNNGADEKLRETIKREITGSSKEDIDNPPAADASISAAENQPHEDADALATSAGGEAKPTTESHL